MGDSDFIDSLHFLKSSLCNKDIFVVGMGVGMTMTLNGVGFESGSPVSPGLGPTDAKENIYKLHTSAEPRASGVSINI